MREIRKSGSEGGGIETNRCFLPLSRLSGGARSKAWMAGTSPAMTREKWFNVTSIGHDASMLCCSQIAADGFFFRFPPTNVPEEMSMTNRLILIAALTVVATATPAHPQAPAVDTILVNGKVVTLDYPSSIG